LDDDLFEIAQVPVKIKVETVKVQNRIADELTRAVVRYITASIIVHQRYCARTELLLPCKKVVIVPRPPHGIDRIVLGEEKGVLNVSCATFLTEALLE
jgi:hypothetical protein